MTEVKECEFGKGLFAARDFRPGEIILQMRGPIVDVWQALSKGEKQSDVLQIRQDAYVDLEDPGRCANHSCDPNAGVRPDLFLTAIKPIAVGKEIRYDYSITMGDGLWEIACHCDSEYCRRMIQDFCTLPLVRQKFYRELNVVQEYLSLNFEIL